jgi:uncharacterized protein YuzE
MKIEYDPEADALYIQFREALAERNVDVTEGVTVDLDKDGNVIGIEVLWVRERFGPDALAKISIENFPVTPAAG